MCFGCSQVGHMKNSCPNQTNRSLKRPSSPVSIPSKKHLGDDDSASSLMSEGSASDSVFVDDSHSPNLPEDIRAQMADQMRAEMSALGDATPFKSPDSPAPMKYRLLAQRESSTVILSVKDVPIVVTPPVSSSVPKKQQKLESKACTLIDCRLIAMWRKEMIAAEDMTTHFRAHHDGLITLDPF